MNSPSELILPSLPQLCLHKFVGKDAPDLLRKIGEFRVNVWRSDEKIISEIDGLDSWIGPFDRKGIHWVVMANNVIVASASLSLHQDRDHFPDYQDWVDIKSHIKPPFSSMNRLVVNRAFRKKGIAAALDRMRIEESMHHNVSSIIVQTREERLRLLERQSFVLCDSKTYQPSNNTWYYMIRYL
jgi:hypothetical protein